MQMVAVRAYHAPATVSECLGVLRDETGGVVVLAGGQSVMPLLRSRELRPEVLLDLGRVDSLRASAVAADGSLELGAMVRHRDVLRDDAVIRGWSALADAAGIIGDRQVQNRGTVGGNVVFGGLGTDMRQVVMCLSGELSVVGPDGERTVSAREAFANGRPIVNDGELLSAVRLPAMGAGSGSAYTKYGITANGRAVIGVAAAVTLDGSGVCTQANVAVGGILPGPRECAGAAGSLVGARLDAELIRLAADAAAQEIAPQDDARASAEYRRQLIRVYARRSLERALVRALEGVS